MNASGLHLQLKPANQILAEEKHLPMYAVCVLDIHLWISRRSIRQPPNLDADMSDAFVTLNAGAGCSP